MTRSILTQLVILLVPAVWCMCGLGCAFPSGLEITEQVEVGTVWRGARANGTFEIINHGTDVIRVRVVRTDCFCTVVDGEQEMIIAARERRRVAVTIETAALDEGPGTRRIELQTDDARTRQATVVLAVDVRTAIELSERSLDFGTLQQGRAASHMIRVSADVSSGIRVSSVSQEGLHLHAELQDRDGVQAIRVRLSPEATTGWHFGTIVVRMSSAELPDVRIPVRARVTDEGMRSSR